MTRSQSELGFIPYDQVYGQGIEDMYHRMPSTEKIRKAIGWEPTLDLDVILADVIKHTRTAPVQPAEADRISV
jgi:UDP-glucose 4-epimerase